MFTPLEHVTIVELIKGLSNKEMAINLDCSEATIKIRMKSVMHKMGVNNRTAAALWALEHDYVPAPIKTPGKIDPAVTRNLVLLAGSCAYMVTQALETVKDGRGLDGALLAAAQLQQALTNLEAAVQGQEVTDESS